MTRPISLGLALLVALLGAAAPARAQTATAAWTQPDAATVAQAQGLTYTLYVNAGTGQVLTSVTCSGSMPAIACAAPLPAGVPVVIDTKYELAARSGSGAEGPRSIPFIKAPGAPTNFRTQ